MNLMHSKAFQFFAVLLAFFAFSSDVLDDISDRGHADAGQTSHSSHHHKGPCGNCAGHNHDEHAIAAVVVISVPAEMPEVFVFPPTDEADPSGLPDSIDHPPQLA